MSANAAGRIYFDPYNPEITANPYPVYRHLREEAPLYYNEQYDFYAVSRFADVERGLEGRIALEEVLKRFPDWKVDESRAVMSSTSTVRGWDTLPVFTRAGTPKLAKSAQP